MHISRRSALSTLAGGLAAALVWRPSPAGASLAVAVSLPELVSSSHRIVFATPTAFHSRWETVAGQRRIVTYSTVRVDEPLEDGSGANEHVIRTLGGRVGDLGQIVHGEPVLARGERGLFFLRDARDGEAGLRVVTARAQGHYLLRADEHGQIRLRQSPHVSDLVQRGTPASRLLAGKSVSDARRVVLEALRDAGR